MTVSIKCECGDQIAFQFESGESAPIYETCDSCSTVWKMEFKKVMIEKESGGNE